ncbi:MAG: hypothetical protein F082_1876 [bacterium F082]|nr:MAG: hypothetical protein F082_1876 [bacterium F082]
MKTTIYTTEQNPWYSFRPYEESDANRFKGRGTDITEMMRLITNHDLVVCYAKSGIGKSSLINAGLIPRLRRKQFLPIPIKFTDNLFVSEYREFETGIRHQIEAEILRLNEDYKSKGINAVFEIKPHPSIVESPFLNDVYGELSSNLWWWFHSSQIVCEREDFDIVYKPIFIFDQFEELFYKATSDEQKENFFSWLLEMSVSRPSNVVQKRLAEIQKQNPDIPISLPANSEPKILLSLREDYVGLLDYWTKQRVSIPAIHSNRYCLMPLDVEQATEVICQQEINGVRVELMDEYACNIIDTLAESDGIPAMLLSVLCNKIYEELVCQKSDTANKLSSFSSGNEDSVKPFIQSLLKSVYAERLTTANLSQRNIQKVEQALVRENGYRKRVEMTDMRSLHLENACRRLADVYLVRIEDHGFRNDGKERVEYVEIIHDRVAEIIAEKRKSEKQIFKKRKLWSIIFVLLLALAWLLYGTLSQEGTNLSFYEVVFVAQEDSLFAKEEFWIADVRFCSDKAGTDSIAMINLQSGDSVYSCRLKKGNQNELKFQLSDSTRMDFIYAIITPQMANTDYNTIPIDLSALRKELVNASIDIRMDIHGKDTIRYKQTIYPIFIKKFIPEQDTIRGYVTNKSDVPLNDVYVAVGNQITCTKQDGSFLILVPASNYERTLYAFKQEYEPYCSPNEKEEHITLKPKGDLDSVFNQRINDVDHLFDKRADDSTLTKDDWAMISYYFVGGNKSNMEKKDLRRHVENPNKPSFKAVSRIINRNSAEYQRKVIGWYNENNTKYYFDGIMILNQDDSSYDMRIKRYDHLFNSLEVNAKLSIQKKGKDYINIFTIISK